jgi:hypothetical protein
MEAIPLPTVCTLDEAALLSQRDRYRRIGGHARLLQRSPRRLRLAIDAEAGDALIAEAVSVERICCPFFSIEWHPDVWVHETRTLEISVSSATYEPALSAIHTALELDRSRAHAAQLSEL